MTGRGTYIRCGRPELDGLLPLVKSFLEKSRQDMIIDGVPIRGYRTPDARSVWIRDYSDMLRGIRYFESDVTSVIDHFAETQAIGGRVFDYFTTFPEKLPCERENWTKYVRVPVEADVEYRFVKAVYLAWQATGDDGWLAAVWPHMERALLYIRHHPWYWDETRSLVKRPYTIDTWDFAYTAGRHEWLQFQFDENTYWGFMHGDNSGYFEAFHLMDRVCQYLGFNERALYWRDMAARIKSGMNSHCWNGRFYTHFVKETPVTIAGVDEAEQLSLSNPMAVNRGVADHSRAVAIIDEYRRRGRESGAFAEWFSIDPPFPDGVFGDEKLVGGAYVNGGIMPLVGGELARAALEHGFERYGVDILAGYHALAAPGESSYLWYFPDGTPASRETSTSPDAEPCDAWGSTAMLYALVEGLAGVQDIRRGFDRVRLSPRWEAAGVETAEVSLEYPASGATFGYKYLRSSNELWLKLKTERSEVELHALLPVNAEVKSVEIEHQPVPFRINKVRESNYLDCDLTVIGEKGINILFK